MPFSLPLTPYTGVLAVEPTTTAPTPVPDTGGTEVPPPQPVQ